MYQPNMVYISIFYQSYESQKEDNDSSHYLNKFPLYVKSYVLLIIKSSKEN